MKKILYISALLGALVSISTSCQKDPLEEVVYSSMTADIAFTTYENAEASINSMYIPLHTIFEFHFSVFSDVPTDIAASQHHVNEDYLNDGMINDTWNINTVFQQFCKAYGRANVSIDEITDMDDSLFEDQEKSKDDLLAEAYFVRAFAYYNLTDIFYRVPLVTTSRLDVNEPQNLSSIEDIEEVMEKDLQTAAKNLPKSWPNTQGNRPTYGAAEGMLVRMYMRKAGRARCAGDEATANTYWQKALTEVNKVLALEGTEYELLDDVFAPFDPATEETLYNKELIWALRGSRSASEGGWSIGMYYSPWMFDTGWESINGTPELAWMYDPEDMRYQKLLITDYQSVYGNPWYYKFPKSAEEIGTLSKVYDSEHQDIEVDVCWVYKYKHLYACCYYYQDPNNFPVMRLSDMILCKAEILNELNGPSAEALSYINRIRERAFTNSEHNLVLSDYPDKASLRSAICDERAMELCMEGVRRSDLIRMGLWKDRMDKYIASIKNRAIWKARNAGHPDDYYADDYKPYPTDLTENDIRRYYPFPRREVELNEDYANNRVF